MNILCFNLVALLILSVLMTTVTSEIPFENENDEAIYVNSLEDVQLPKRAFHGMRGKKSDFLYENQIPQEFLDKRTSSFMGMRGKKSYIQPELDDVNLIEKIHSIYKKQFSGMRGKRGNRSGGKFRDYKSRNGGWWNFGEKYFWPQGGIGNNPKMRRGGGNSGFVGMRG